MTFNASSFYQTRKTMKGTWDSCVIKAPEMSWHLAIENRFLLMYMWDNFDHATLQVILLSCILHMPHLKCQMSWHFASLNCIWNSLVQLQTRGADVTTTKSTGAGKLADKRKSSNFHYLPSTCFRKLSWEIELETCNESVWRNWYRVKKPFLSLDVDAAARKRIFANSILLDASYICFYLYLWYQYEITM